MTFTTKGTATAITTVNDLNGQSFYICKLGILNRSKSNMDPIDQINPN